MNKGYIVAACVVAAIVFVMMGDVGFDWVTGFTVRDLQVTRYLMPVALMIIAVAVVVGAIVAAAAPLLRKKED